jgi:hypothetical protein
LPEAPAACNGAAGRPKPYGSDLNSHGPFGTLDTK